MSGFRFRPAHPRWGLVAFAAITAMSLAGCNGGSSSIPGFGTNNGFVRFVNGSPDIGAIDVLIDGNKINTSPLAYGQVTAYQQLSSTGSHAVTINVSGTGTSVGNIADKPIGANGSTYTSFVLAGELHPVNPADTPNLLQFTDTTYSSSTNGNVNFHNAAPVLTSSQPSVNFGWYVSTAPTTFTQLGTSEAVGGVTGPQPLSANAPASAGVGFYAVSASGTGAITTLPSNIDPTGCATNKYPCNSGNLSLYLIDGPAASTQPTAGPYPAGISSTTQAGLVGIFDAQGT